MSQSGDTYSSDSLASFMPISLKIAKVHAKLCGTAGSKRDQVPNRKAPANDWSFTMSNTAPQGKCLKRFN